MVEKKATRQRGKKARRRGLAAVEFALVAIPLFLLVIGIIDYGLLFLKVQQVTQAARHGARAAVLADATNGTVDAAIDLILSDAGIDTYSVVRNPSDVAGVSGGTTIEIQITVPTNQIALIRTSIVPIPPNLVAAAAMAKEY